MPKGKTKTGLIRSPRTTTVPPICVSKPTGMSCQIFRYNCSGQLMGIIPNAAETPEGCEAAAAQYTTGKVYWRWFDQYNAVSRDGSFDHCPLPPIIVDVDGIITPGGPYSFDWAVFHQGSTYEASSFNPQGWTYENTLPPANFPAGHFVISPGPGAPTGTYNTSFGYQYRPADDVSCYWIFNFTF